MPARAPGHGARALYEWPAARAAGSREHATPNTTPVPFTCPRAPLTACVDALFRLPPRGVVALARTSHIMRDAIGDEGINEAAGLFRQLVVWRPNIFEYVMDYATKGGVPHYYVMDIEESGHWVVWSDVSLTSSMAWCRGAPWARHAGQACGPGIGIGSLG